MCMRRVKWNHEYAKLETYLSHMIPIKGRTNKWFYFISTKEIRQCAKIVLLYFSIEYRVQMDKIQLHQSVKRFYFRIF